MYVQRIPCSRWRLVGSDLAEIAQRALLRRGVYRAVRGVLIHLLNLQNESAKTDTKKIRLRTKQSTLKV